jgi:hypothetical protein
MAWSSRTEPTTGCGHAYQMSFRETRCWCRGCGQTWWLALEGPKKGWKPLPVEEVYANQKTDEDPW